MASRPATVILENVAGILDFQVELVAGLFLGVSVGERLPSLMHCSTCLSSTWSPWIDF